MVLEEVENNSSRLVKIVGEKIMELEEKIDKSRSIYQELVKKVILRGYSDERAVKTAEKLWNTDKIKVIAIDGTCKSWPIYDQIIFYAGATSVESIIDLSKGLMEKIDIVPTKTYDLTTITSLYAYEALQSIMSNEYDFLTIEDLIEQSPLPRYLMNFAEHYLAWKKAVEDKPHVLLLDGLMYVKLYSLFRGTKKSILFRRRKPSNILKQTALYKLHINGMVIDERVLDWGRFIIPGHPRPDIFPPRNPPYLKYCILNALLARKEPMTFDEIKSMFDEKFQVLVEAMIYDGKNSGSSDGREIVYPVPFKEFVDIDYEKRQVSLKEELKRIEAALDDLLYKFGEHIFEDYDENPLILRRGEPFNWESDEEKKIVTVIDVHFMSFLAFNRLLGEALRNKILLIGVSKDSTCRDFQRTVMPYLLNRRVASNPILDEIFLVDGVMKNLSKVLEFQIPDRDLLQLMSVNFPEEMVPIWSTFEYDSAFSRMKYYANEKLFESYRDMPSPTYLFVKMFVQLSPKGSRSTVKSNVLVVDRLVVLDEQLEPALKTPIEISLGKWRKKNDIEKFEKDYNLDTLSYFSSEQSPIRDLLLMILDISRCDEIPEAFGHNYLLYQVDRNAKSLLEFIEKACVKPAIRRFKTHPSVEELSFFLTSFRRRRSRMELMRRRSRY